jgi:hypothetical protein
MINDYGNLNINLKSFNPALLGAPFMLQISDTLAGRITTFYS